MNSNDTTKALCIAIIALCLPYCSEKEAKVKTYDAGVSITVEHDVLRAAIERRLCALEQVKIQPNETKKQSVPVSASEAVGYRESKTNHPPQ